LLVRERKEQIAVVAAFGTKRSPLVADFHLVSAFGTGQPILRLVFHAMSPKIIDAEIGFLTQ
jgi:hypothetical protein